MTAGFILASCGGQEYVPPSRLPRKREAAPPPEIPEMLSYTYPGGSNRDPFRRSAARRPLPTDAEVMPIADFSGLQVTGLISGPLGNFALISGQAENYLARSGRLFNDDDQEVPGVSVVFRDEVIILISEDNEIYELKVP